MQFLGPSQNVTNPLHPLGNSEGGGMPPGMSHLSGLKIPASGPHTAGLVFMVVKGIKKT
jgi:hypothetical protein